MLFHESGTDLHLGDVRAYSHPDLVSWANNQHGRACLRLHVFLPRPWSFGHLLNILPDPHKAHGRTLLNRYSRKAWHNDGSRKGGER